MSTHLSRFFRQRRLALGLRPGQLAEQTDHRKCKAANRICLFEERGEIDPRLFPKLQKALGITDTEVAEQTELDRREHFQAWLTWVNTPVPPHLIVRLLPAFYSRNRLPDGLVTLEEMEQYASQFAKEHRMMVWLCPTRRFSIRFDVEGNKIAVVEASPDQQTLPTMSLANSRRPFLLDWKSGTLSGSDMPQTPMVQNPPSDP